MRRVNRFVKRGASKQPLATIPASRAECSTVNANFNIPYYRVPGYGYVSTSVEPQTDKKKTESPLFNQKINDSDVNEKSILLYQ